MDLFIIEGIAMKHFVRIPLLATLLVVCMNTGCKPTAGKDSSTVLRAENGQTNGGDARVIKEIIMLSFFSGARFGYEESLTAKLDPGKVNYYIVSCLIPLKYHDSEDIFLRIYQGSCQFLEDSGIIRGKSMEWVQSVLDALPFFELKMGAIKEDGREQSNAPEIWKTIRGAIVPYRTVTQLEFSGVNVGDIVKPAAKDEFLIGNMCTEEYQSVCQVDFDANLLVLKGIRLK